MNPNSKELTPICYTRLVGEITESLTRELLKEIDNANSNPNKKIIILTICSTGGLLYYSQAIYDAIKASKKPVVGIATGTCMSVAVMILQATHKRISRTNTRFMLHPSVHWRGDKTYIDEMNIISEKWNIMYKNFIARSLVKSTLTFEEFEKIAKPRKYLSADEAFKLKLVDTISDEWVDSY